MFLFENNPALIKLMTNILIFHKIIYLIKELCYLLNINIHYYIDKFYFKDKTINSSILHN